MGDADSGDEQGVVGAPEEEEKVAPPAGGAAAAPSAGEAADAAPAAPGPAGQGKENGKPNGLDEFGRTVLKRSRSPLDPPSDGAEEPPRKRHKPSPERQSWAQSGSRSHSRRERSESSSSSNSDNDVTGRIFGNDDQIRKDAQERQAKGREKLLALEHGETLEAVFCHSKDGRAPWAPFGIAAKPCMVAVWRRLLDATSNFEGFKELDYWKYIEAVADRSGLYVLYVVKYLFEVRDAWRRQAEGGGPSYLEEPPKASAEDLEWQYQVVNCVVNYGDERGWGWSQPKNVFVSKFVAEFEPELVILTMKKIREFNPETFDKLAAHYIDKIVDDSDSFLQFITELTEDAPSVVEVGSLIMQAYKGPDGVFQYFRDHYRDAEDSGEIDEMWDLKDENEEGGPQPQEGDTCLAVWRWGEPRGEAGEGELEHEWKPAVVESIDDSGRYFVDFDAECYPPPKKKKKDEYDEPVERFFILREPGHVKWKHDHPKFEPRSRWDELTFHTIFLWRVAKAKNMSTQERTKFVAFITREWSRGEMKGYVDPLKEIMDVENEDFSSIVPVGVMYKPVDVDFDKQGMCC